MIVHGIKIKFNSTAFILLTLISNLLLIAGLISHGIQEHGSRSRADEMLTPRPRPYWRRAGCFRIGHTRTIKIDGCLMFNITTDACRGYCMSYAVPSPEDIGPLDSERLELAPDEVAAHDEGGPFQLGGDRVGAQFGSIDSDFGLGSGRLPNSALPGYAQHGVRPREVFSESQCCNMLETREQKINVLCKVKGTRRMEMRELKFESAITCGCSFCKHL